MKTPKKASTVLRRAARVIRERGWCQDQYGDDQGRLCLVGALKTAYGLPLHAGPVRGPLALQVGQCFRTAVDMPPDDAYGAQMAIWNDNPRRTKAQVLRAFERAAKLAEKAEAKR